MQNGTPHNLYYCIKLNGRELYLLGTVETELHCAYPFDLSPRSGLLSILTCTSSVEHGSSPLRYFAKAMCLRKLFQQEAKLSCWMELLSVMKHSFPDRDKLCLRTHLQLMLRDYTGGENPGTEGLGAIGDICWNAEGEFTSCFFIIARMQVDTPSPGVWNHVRIVKNHHFYMKLLCCHFF